MGNKDSKTIETKQPESSFVPKKSSSLTNIRSQTAGQQEEGFSFVRASQLSSSSRSEKTRKSRFGKLRQSFQTTKGNPDSKASNFTYIKSDQEQQKPEDATAKSKATQEPKKGSQTGIIEKKIPSESELQRLGEDQQKRKSLLQELRNNLEKTELGKKNRDKNISAQPIGGTKIVPLHKSASQGKSFLDYKKELCILIFAMIFI